MTSPANLPARELDALVAREVMGWCEWDGESDLTCQCGKPHFYSGRDWIAVYDPNDESGDVTRHVRFSQDGDSMLTVLDALRERGWRATLYAEPVDREGWVVSVSTGTVGSRDRRYLEAEAATLPRAVCEAALAAVGGK